MTGAGVAEFLPAGRQGHTPEGKRIEFRKMYYVYVIQSTINSEFYKGISNNVEKRIKEHNNGKTSSTKNKRPFKLIYVHECIDRTEARRWEKFFKSGIGREIVRELARVLEWQTGTA